MTHSQHDSTIPDTSLNGEHINQFAQSMPIDMMAAAAQAHLPHLYNHNPTTHPAQFSNGNNNSNHSNHSSPRLAHPPLATPGAAPVASTPTTSTSHSLNASPLSTPPPLPPPTSAASLVGLHHHLSHIPAPAPPVPVTTAPSEEEPLYVNAKQYHRILKRRTARLRLEELNRIARSRKPYLHESRHKHAMRRPRGPGGRFLTSSEIAALEKQKGHEDPSHHGQNQTQLESE